MAAMTRREGSDADGTPAAAEVQQDFSVPGDADRLLAEDVGGEDLDEDPA